GFRTRRFPAFYSSESDLPLDLTADSPEQIGALYRAQQSLGLRQGILVANPVDREHEIPREVMEGYIRQALEELDRRGVTGKGVTPFLLARIVELSGGRALETNVHLVLSNVRLACAIARTLTAEGGAGRTA
ncbi:MAG: pseudouridine-5'-phosphate glycosidase, partial [Spirochaetales bacterium]|nr:pseudouridine-5'-phosphate glycosidase [Spirochaetales bacterium]